MAVGGAAYLVSKAIREAEVFAFEELDMEAIYEFDMQNMPVTVAVDSSGTSVHKTGPAEWQAKISARFRSRSHEGCIKLLNGGFQRRSHDESGFHS